MPSLDKASLLPQPPTLHGIIPPLALLGVLGGVIVLLHYQADELSYLANKKNKNRKRIRYSGILNSHLNHFCPSKKAGRVKNAYQLAKFLEANHNLTTICLEKTWGKFVVFSFKEQVSWVIIFLSS